MSMKCPILVKKKGFVIDNTPTEFVVVDYKTHLLIQITQVGRVGKLVRALRDKPDQLDGNSTFTISNFLGSNDDKLDVLALQLVTALNLHPPYKSLLLAYSCKTSPSISTLLNILRDIGIGNAPKPDLLQGM